MVIVSQLNYGQFSTVSPGLESITAANFVLFALSTPLYEFMYVLSLLFNE